MNGELLSIAVRTVIKAGFLVRNIKDISWKVTVRKRNNILDNIVGSKINGTSNVNYGAKINQRIILSPSTTYKFVWHSSQARRFKLKGIFIQNDPSSPGKINAVKDCKF